MHYVKVQQDLQRRGIKPHLWLTPNLRKGGKMLNPMAPYILTTNEFNSFATTIKNLKTHSGHFLVMGK
jgi:hypothetical protein